MRHNEGTIVRPIGRPARGFSIVPDSILCDASLSPAGRLILAYLAGRPDGWVACVTDICRKLGLTEKQWRGARGQLRSAGVIPEDHPKRIGGGATKFSWVLDVHLDKYCSELSTGLSTGHPTKRADGFHPPFPMDGVKEDNQQEKKETMDKPPPHAKRDVGGGGGGEFTRLRDQATQPMRELLDAEVDLLNQKIEQGFEVRSPERYRLTLARKAAAGTLTGTITTSADAAGKNVKPAVPRQPIQTDKNIVGWVADCNYYGQLTVLNNLGFASQKLNCSFDPCSDDAAHIWRRQNRGDLIFKPAT